MNNLQKHIAGATIRHNSKFEHLESYRNEVEMTQEFRNEWIIPFYMHLNNDSDEWIEAIKRRSDKMSDTVILNCLGDFNWRTRQTGAFFTCVKNKKEYIKIVGTHLLKSEVCYAAREYAITLSYFNNKSSISYLNDYLNYYLLHPELPFDQMEVITAVKYLDEVNNTNVLNKHLKNWESFLNKGQEAKTNQIDAILSNPNTSEEIKNRIFEITQNDVLDYEIETTYVHDRINTIRKIVNKVI